MRLQYEDSYGICYFTDRVILTDRSFVKDTDLGNPCYTDELNRSGTGFWNSLPVDFRSSINQTRERKVFLER